MASSNRPDLPIQCRSCGLQGFRQFSTLQVTDAKETKDGTYLLNGTLNVEYCAHGQCQNCGSVYTLLRRDLPIQCVDLPCPRCDKADKLVYRMKTIELGPKSFSFKVEVVCRRCSWRHSAAKVLRALWDSLRIKVSPTNISVEKISRSAGVK
jgi:hypothetical protein